MGEAFAFLAGFLLGMMAAAGALLAAEVEVTLRPRRFGIGKKEKTETRRELPPFGPGKPFIVDAYRELPPPKPEEETEDEKIRRRLLGECLDIRERMELPTPEMVRKEKEKVKAYKELLEEIQIIVGLAERQLERDEEFLRFEARMEKKSAER